MKKLITERDLERHPDGQPFRLSSEMILTPSARDHASRRGIEMVYPERSAGGAGESAMDRAIREAVLAELGHADREVIQAVRAGLGGAKMPAPEPSSSAETPTKALRKAIETEGRASRAVLSAMGSNHGGILAALTSVISELGGDVEGVSQTIVRGYFSMIVVVNIDPLEQRGVTFEAFRDRLQTVAKAGGFQVMVMHEDVLRAMHRV